MYVHTCTYNIVIIMSYCNNGSPTYVKMKGITNPQEIRKGLLSLHTYQKKNGA